MRGKVGLVIGLAAGYVLGTRAGRERYEQIKEQALKVWNLDPVQKQVDRAKAQVHDHLIQLSPIFTKTKHMLGDDFTMLDVAIAPLLWRLDHYGIQMGKDAAPMMKYAERMFSRQGFIDALTPSERAMRK